MYGTQRRQFEMLTRVQDFGNTYREQLASSPVGQQLLAGVRGAIDELTATEMKRLAASKAARADRKSATRAALVDVLRKGGQLARVLRAEGAALPSCDLPASQSDQALLMAGRQLAIEAANFHAEFDGHGMPSAHITDVTAAFEAAAADRGVGRAGHVAAAADIRRLLAKAIRLVRRLDLVIVNLLPKDDSALDAWQQVRRIEEVRGPRAGDTTSTAPDEPKPTEAQGAEPTTDASTKAA